MNDPEADFIVLDASLWVSRLVPQDRFHHEVKTWIAFQRSKSVVFLSPALLLPEIAGAISRQTGDSNLARQAVEKLQNLSELRLVEMDHSLVQEAAYLAANFRLHGADSVHVSLANRLTLPLATPDKKQKDKAATIIEVLEIEL